jgi:hypothetical protein
VIHERHYTPEQANGMLPRLKPLLLELRSAKDKLTDAEAHEVLAEAAPGNGGGGQGRQVGEAFLEVRAMLAQLEALDLVVRDVDRGLVDFPAVLEGREVYLCWELGEDEVGFWHDLEGGYGGRQRLA